MSDCAGRRDRRRCVGTTLRNCGKDCGMSAAEIKRKLRNFPGANLQLRLG
jgi:hypothetical protein